jgi:hypothetical protein
MHVAHVCISSFSLMILLLDSGSTMTQISKFAKLMKLLLISDSLYYRYQRSLAIPAIEAAYLESINEACEISLKKGI